MMLSNIEVMDNVYEDFCKAKPNGMSELKFLQSLLDNYTQEPTVSVEEVQDDSEEYLEDLYDEFYEVLDYIKAEKTRLTKESKNGNK